MNKRRLRRMKAQKRLARRWTPLMWLVNFVFPFWLILSLLAVIAFSEVPPNLWVLHGTIADVVLGAYIVVLIAIIARPSDARLNQIGAPLAVLVFLGRAGGFLTLVVDSGRTDLIGAVVERVAFAIGVVTWHMFKSWRAGLRDCMRGNFELWS